MGHQLNGLSVKELHNIESQLEMSLRGIRMKKVMLISLYTHILKLDDRCCDDPDTLVGLK